MSNSGVIATKNKDLAVYLHWNGGRDSVEPFLEYCKIKGYRAPEQDCYGWARLCQVIGNFFGGSTSIGIDRYEKSCIGDHGVYIIENWEIVDRENSSWEADFNDRLEMLKSINKAQPKEEQIDERYFEAELVSVAQLNKYDKVFVDDYREGIKLVKILGLGEDKVINGTNVKSMPYSGEFANDNINAYLTEKAYRRLK